MDRREWHTYILREANAFVAPREADLRAALDECGHIRDFDADLEAQVHDFLARTDEIHDLVRFSGLIDKDPALWQDAPDWDSALFRVAYACLLHDLSDAALRILRDQLPRAAPGQIVV